VKVTALSQRMIYYSVKHNNNNINNNNNSICIAP